MKPGHKLILILIWRVRRLPTKNCAYVLARPRPAMATLIRLWILFDNTNQEPCHYLFGGALSVLVFPLARTANRQRPLRLQVVSTLSPDSGYCIQP